MKKLFTALLLITMMFSLVACGDNNEDNKIMTDGEKNMLMATSLPGEINVSPSETYQITMPYETKELVFTSDSEQIAMVENDGTIIPVSDGSCIVEIYADGLYYYSIVNVTGTHQKLENADRYAAYTADGFSADTIKKEMETYASVKYGTTIKQDLIDEDKTNMVLENPFTISYNHSGCEVKYKLLTSIASLEMQGCKELAIQAEKNDEQIICYFYAK